MKKVLFSILIIMMVISCKEMQFYDISAPEIIYSNLLPTNNFLIQFNEPIVEFSYRVEEAFEQIEIMFPKGNMQIPYEALRSMNDSTIVIKAKDTAGIDAVYEVAKPKINDNPAKLSIHEVQLKYSKKSPQRLFIKATSPGETTGYKMFAFIRNDFVRFNFDDISLRQNDIIELIFDPNEAIYDEFTIKRRKNIVSFKNFRLSSSCSLVYILDNRNKVVDYFLYADTKKNDIEYYKSNSRSFKKVYAEIAKIVENPCITDVKGNTTKKTIVKNAKGYYYIKK